MQVTRQPSGAVGGQPFQTQPKVAVYDGTRISVDYVGYVYAILDKAPVEYQHLHIGLCNSTDECGDKLENDVVAKTFKIPVKDGIATFSGLQLKTAGSGYIIRFIGLTSMGSPFAYVDSVAFAVATGDPYQLQFHQHHGPAWGGTVIALQPAVAVVDRGGNIVTSIDTKYYVTVELSGNPTGAVLYPEAQSSRTVKVVGGVAQFQGLYINEAAKDYRFSYHCNKVPLLECFEIIVVAHSSYLALASRTCPLTVRFGAGISPFPSGLRTPCGLSDAFQKEGCWPASFSGRLPG